MCFNCLFFLFLRLLIWLAFLLFTSLFNRSFDRSDFLRFLKKFISTSNRIANTHPPTIAEIDCCSSSTTPNGNSTPFGGSSGPSIVITNSLFDSAGYPTPPTSTVAEILNKADSDSETLELITISNSAL